MKITELTAVGIRIFAIYLLLYALSQLIASISFFSSETDINQSSVSLYFYLAFVGIPIVISLLIWFFPLTATKCFLPKYKKDEIEPFSQSELYITAIVILGIFILSEAIPDALFWISRFYFQAKIETTGMQVELTPDSKAAIISTIVELLLGIWLLLGSQGILGFIVKARSWPNK